MHLSFIRNCYRLRTRRDPPLHFDPLEDKANLRSYFIVLDVAFLLNVDGTILVWNVVQ